jgi:hypothetical protein
MNDRDLFLGINGSDLLLLDRRLWSIQNSRLQNSQISNLGFLCREIFWSGRSADTCPLTPVLQVSQISNLFNQSADTCPSLSLQVFDLSTQINGPVALLSINGRDLLRVFGLLRSQISNFTLFQMDFI